MADTDVLGILSLLLAVAGAAYLVWARVLRSGADRVVSGREAPSNRSAETIPPTLRPQSEISPKMLAKQQARSGQDSPRSPDGTRSSVAARGKPAAKSQVPPASRAASKSGAAKSAKKVDPADEVPHFHVEEDEELEPTKMGRVAKSGAIQPIVERIVFDEGADAAAPRETSPMLAIYALGQTDPGKRRKQNQDSFLVLDDASVFIVADGMGGHRGGQRASKLAVKTIGDAFERKSFDASPHTNIPLEASELARSIQMANTAIFEEAKREPDLAGMGTTLCAVRFAEDKRRLYIGHVGDSRCYRVRDGVMKQITTDHTMADYGVTGPEGAHLSRALGPWPTVPIDLIMASPMLGDVYLICSDGLTKMIPDGTIATQLLHEEDPKAAVERLIFFANAHGGKDNITVLLLRVVEPGWAPPSDAT
jgi:protein phosphatase